MNRPARPRSASAVRLGWAVAIAIGAVLAIASAEWHGRSSRTAFHPPASMPSMRVASVATAADALLVWREAGAHGRRLVVLTGRWSGPQDGSTAGATGADARQAPFGSGRPGDPLTPMSALYWAAHLGVVRSFDVVMPPAAFELRVAADDAARDGRREDGAFRHDLHGFWLRFSSPRAFLPPAEPALVLVEPTWFAPGAPSDPVAWLSSVGVRAELVLVALGDPAATQDHRRAAATYVRSAQVPFLDLERSQ